MPVILIFVNYLITLFVGLAALSGAAPWWILGIVPIAVVLQYKLYRAGEVDDEIDHSHPAHT